MSPYFVATWKRGLSKRQVAAANGAIHAVDPRMDLDICLCGAPARNGVCSVDGCVASAPIGHDALEAHETEPWPWHTHDTDCTVGEDNCCTVCGVEHGDACPTCGQRAYHTAGCETSGTKSG
jgi:hypothetical protein